MYPNTFQPPSIVGVTGTLNQTQLRPLPVQDIATAIYNIWSAIALSNECIDGFPPDQLMNFRKLTTVPSNKQTSRSITARGKNRIQQLLIPICPIAYCGSWDRIREGLEQRVIIDDSGVSTLGYASSMLNTDLARIFWDLGFRLSLTSSSLASMILGIPYPIASRLQHLSPGMLEGFIRSIPQTFHLNWNVASFRPLTAPETERFTAEDFAFARFDLSKRLLASTLASYAHNAHETEQPEKNYPINILITDLMRAFEAGFSRGELQELFIGIVTQKELNSAIRSSSTRIRESMRETNLRHPPKELRQFKPTSLTIFEHFLDRCQRSNRTIPEQPTSFWYADRLMHWIMLDYLCGKKLCFPA